MTALVPHILAPVGVGSGGIGWIVAATTKRVLSQLPAGSKMLT